MKFCTARNKSISFDLIVVIDWSASSTPGPLKESADRCWIAWSEKGNSAKVQYFRTRFTCMQHLKHLVSRTNGNCLLAFDFPFGYPAGSNLGGGRKAARRISEYMTCDERDGNNRFEVANLLNQQISALPGPFWGCPRSKNLSHLGPKKPPFHHSGFNEWRIVERHLRLKKQRIMNVWQLLGQASVGSQTLTGLSELNSFASEPGAKKPVKFWPFETTWEKDLKGVILAECWPSMNDFASETHPIKDARQVSATLKWLQKHQDKGTIPSLFKAPDFLTQTEMEKCGKEEGWILGIDEKGIKGI
ncbi:MAG: hypothetical protein MI743_20605 [Sneathiellales bacterium]|nr:hypothetical protein [Sneathiellales bacterium]